MTKRIIEAVTDIKSLDIYDRNVVNTLDGFIENLEVIRTQLFNDGWKDLKIIIDVEYGYDDYDAELEFKISGLRPETDKEEMKRLKAEERAEALKKIRAETKAKQLENQKVKELAELARLKAKYEENND